MILSVSRRTDIPACFPEWFLNRVREGFLYVRNPRNHKQVSKILLTPEVVDCMVFWTKNPAPILPYLSELSQLSPFYFQVTITGYGKDVEPGVPDKKRTVIPAFQKLSAKVGKNKVIWRYDPILFSRRYTPEYHLKAFGQIAEALSGTTEKCVISFVDLYAKNKKSLQALERIDLPQAELFSFAAELAKMAEKCGMKVTTCAEKMDLSNAGIDHNCCIDRKLIEELTGAKLNVKKDPSQRSECGCIESIDVGSYNTCPQGCRYCYANESIEMIRKTRSLYDPASPILCGRVTPDDHISERKVKSVADRQMRLLLSPDTAVGR